MVVALVVISISLFLFVELLVAALNRTAKTSEAPETTQVRGFASLRLPRGLFLGAGHTWSRLLGSGEFEVGIDELLSQAIDGADRVELPEPGTELRKGQPLATIWRMSRKLVVPAPVSGTVVTCNKTADHAPAALSADTYGAGWLVKMWPVDHKEAVKSLRVGEEAFQWLGREVQRFTEFLAMRSAPKLVGATLADGARPVVGAALSLDEEAWAEFEKEFTASH